MASESRGALAKWDEEKQEGYIRPSTGGVPLYVRKEDFGKHTPTPGEKYRYEKAIRADGKALAKRLAPVIRSENLEKRPKKTFKKKKRQLVQPLIVFALYFGLFQFLVYQYVYPVIWLRIQLIICLLTFLLMAWDKLSAVKQWYRVPEAYLHLAEILGGWPGGLVAQQVFRHKVRKIAFRRVFVGCVVLHLGIMALLAAPGGYWGTATFDDYLPAQGQRLQEGFLKLYRSLNLPELELRGND